MVRERRESGITDGKRDGGSSIEAILLYITVCAGFDTTDARVVRPFKSCSDICHIGLLTC